MDNISPGIVIISGAKKTWYDDKVVLEDVPKGWTYYLFRKLHFSDDLRDINSNPINEDTRKLIILIHGWNPDGDKDPFEKEPWKSVSDNIQSWLSENPSDWRLIHYNWARDADTGPIYLPNPAKTLEYIQDKTYNDKYQNQEPLGIDTWPTQNGTEAAEASHAHGQNLGELLYSKCPNLQKVQFIAHSAGTWCARTAAFTIADQFNQMGKTIHYQVTLLDPYIPKEGNAESALGKGIIGRLDNQSPAPTLLENYYTKDITGNGTEQTFNWRSSDIQIEIDKSNYSLFALGHDIPKMYYADTVKDAINGGSQNTGWLNSLPYIESQQETNVSNYRLHE